MSDLISRELLVKEIVNRPTKQSGYNPVYLNGCATRQNEIIDIINDMPSVEAVPKSYAEQIRWERDVAVGQLNEIGCQFGQKMDEVKDKLEALQWIPCSERMPENYETVNITWVNRRPAPYYEHIKDKLFTGTAVFHYGKWYWYSCVCEDYLRECGDSTCDRMDKDIEIIAWMPLPEPYKADMRTSAE